MQRYSKRYSNTCLNKKIRKKGDSCASATKDKSTTNRFIFLPKIWLIFPQPINTSVSALNGSNFNYKEMDEENIMQYVNWLKNDFTRLLPYMPNFIVLANGHSC